MIGWKELLGHTRAWAVVIGIVFQALVACGVVLAGDRVAYLEAHAPVILAALWSALVLGKSYEDRMTGGRTSALRVWRDPTRKEGGWAFALGRLLSDEGFVVTLVGTVVAVVALCLPLWPGLATMEATCIKVAYAVATLAGMLTGALKYSAAHSDGTLSLPDPPPAVKPPDTPSPP